MPRPRKTYNPSAPPVDPPIIPGQPKGLRFEIIGSIAELGELAETYNTTHTTESKWAGGSLTEALDLAAHGWDEPLPDVEAITNTFAPTLVFTPTMDVSGCEVDIDLYLQGEPECMRDFPLSEREVASVSVLLPICYGGIVSEEAVRKRGIAVAAALEELRSQGVAVTVYVYLQIAGRGHSNKYNPPSGSPLSITLVRVADTRLAYDLARITYAVGHPTVLRQLFFGYEDGWCREDRRTWGIENNGGRGSSPYSLNELNNSRQDIVDFVKSQLDTEVTVMIPSLHYNNNKWSMDRHMEYIEGFFTQDQKVDEDNGY